MIKNNKDNGACLVIWLSAQQNTAVRLRLGLIWFWAVASAMLEYQKYRVIKCIKVLSHLIY